MSTKPRLPSSDPSRAPPAAPPLPWTPQPMTQWFDPRQLVRTGIRALLSGIFGAYADQREMQAALAHGSGADVHDYADGSEFWLDYMADLGDGFDATYTTAWLLGRSELSLPAATGAPHATRRGQVLVLGGDQVYPTASREQYESRFSGPVDAALPWLDEDARPHLYAVPGNHDWYDGLTSFMRLFCQRRSIGAWATQQARSYFALKLPHGWWLLGIDIQLAADIDQPQLDYFADVARKIAPGDHVILCTAQPSWVEEVDGAPANRNLAFFEQRVIAPSGARLVLALSGDLHHYARYADSTGTRHRVTAGGGGAYLYGTHRLPDAIELDAAAPADAGQGADAGSGTETYTRQAEYPSSARSRRLRWGALLLGVRNPGFVVTLGLAYSLCGWLLLSATQSAHLLDGTGSAGPPANALLVWLAGQPWHAAGRVCRVLTETMVQVPVLVVMAALLVGGLYAFCQPDPGRPAWWRAIGIVHGLAHLALLLLLAWACAHVLAAAGLAGDGSAGLWLSGGAYVAWMLAVGGPLGALLFGLALLPGVNLNEAFSAQHIPHYRNFLRLHIAADGALTVYPVGIDRSIRWVRDARAGARDPAFCPADGRPPAPHLIERPFTIPGPGARRAARAADSQPGG